MQVIRTQRGLGDAVYCYPVIKRLAEQHPITVITNYGFIYENLPNVSISNDFHQKYDLFLRYTRHGRGTQFEQIQSCAGLSGLRLHLDWDADFSTEFRNKYLDTIRGKNICIVKEPCAAHMHKRSRDLCVAPSSLYMQEFINRNDFYYISVGQDEVFKKRLLRIDLDLNNKILIKDLITLVKYSNFIITQVGHLVVLAQAFNKQLKVFYPEKMTEKIQHIVKEKIE